MSSLCENCDPCSLKILFPRSQAPAWERICARSPGFGQSPVTGSRGLGTRNKETRFFDVRVRKKDMQSESGWVRNLLILIRIVCKNAAAENADFIKWVCTHSRTVFKISYNREKNIEVLIKINYNRQFEKFVSCMDSGLPEITLPDKKIITCWFY